MIVSDDEPNVNACARLPPSDQPLKSRRVLLPVATDCGAAMLTCVPTPRSTVQGVGQLLPSTITAIPAGLVVTVTRPAATYFAVSTSGFFGSVVCIVTVWLAGPPLLQLTNVYLRPEASVCVAGGVTSQ